MATQASTERRRRVTVPFLTLVVGIALVAGLAIGVQSLRSANNAGAVGAATAPTIPPQYIDHGAANGGNPVSIPLPKSGVTSQPCSTLDARAYAPYCDSSYATRVATPRATWLACEAMDAAAYRQLCHQGDGGRWIEGARSAGQ